MRVDEVVGEILGLAEGLDARDELGQVLVHDLARHGALGPGGEVNDAGALAEGDDAPDPGSCERVNTSTSTPMRPSARADSRT